MLKASNLKLMTDCQLMEQFVKLQNEQGFVELYQRYFSEVCRYVAWLMGDCDAAQDLVQNVFLKVYQRPKLFNPEKEFNVWLFSIAKNAWRNELRAKSIRKLHHENVQLDVCEETGADHSSRLKEVENALTYLSVEHREVFVLKYSNNLSLEEISEVCNCSLGTVKSRLFYALKNLRELIKTKKSRVDHE